MSLADAIKATKKAVAEGRRFDPGPVKMLKDGDAYFSLTYGYPPEPELCVEIEPFGAPQKPADEWTRSALSDDVARARSAFHKSAPSLSFERQVDTGAMKVPRSAIYALAARYARGMAGFDPVRFLILDTSETMYYAPKEGAVEEGWFVQ